MLLFATHEWLNPEFASIIISIVTAISGSFLYIWRKIIKPLFKIFKSNEKILETINDIKKELSTNGGGSIKDSIICLKDTCSRIEKTQKVLEQRSRSSLNFADTALFETDKDGNLVWSNEKFLELTNSKSNEISGYDWVSKIKEEGRSEFIEEFQSCIHMCRKFEFVTELDNHKVLKFKGFPIKVGDKEHHGFLFHVILI